MFYSQYSDMEFKSLQDSPITSCLLDLSPPYLSASPAPVRLSISFPDLLQNTLRQHCAPCPYTQVIDGLLSRPTPTSILLTDANMFRQCQQYLIQYYKLVDIRRQMGNQIKYFKDLKDQPRNFQPDIEQIARKFWYGHQLVEYRRLKGREDTHEKGEPSSELKGGAKGHGDCEFILKELEGSWVDRSGREGFMRELKERLERLIQEQKTTAQTGQIRSKGKLTSIILEEQSRLNPLPCRLKTNNERLKLLTTEQQFPTKILRPKQLQSQCSTTHKWTLHAKKLSMDYTGAATSSGQIDTKKKKKPLYGSCNIQKGATRLSTLPNEVNSTSLKRFKLTTNSRKKNKVPERINNCKSHDRLINPKTIISQGIAEAQKKLVRRPRG